MKDSLKKNIIFIITYIAVIIFALVNFDKILGILAYSIKVLSPFLIGIILAVILNVLVNFIENNLFGEVKPNSKWYKAKRPISITFSLIIVIILIVFIVNLLVPQLRNSLSLFTESLPSYKADIVDIMYKFNADYDTIDKVSGYLDNFSTVITDYIKGNSKDVISGATEIASSVLSIISTAIIAIVFAIYMIAQKETLQRQINKVMEAYLKPRTVSKINSVASNANAIFSSFITGQCLEALIFGTLCFIGMLIFGFPFAPTIAVLLGFTALIPMFGSFIGTALGAILIMMVSPLKAILFVVFIIILQQIDNNFIYPKVVGKSVGLSGMWVLLSVIVGANVGGILGIIIATPLCSLLYNFFAEVVNDRLKRNKIVSKVNQK